MGDLIFVLVTLAFFAICVAYVNWCDRIIGPDEFVAGSDSADPTQASPTPNGSREAPSQGVEVAA